MKKQNIFLIEIGIILYLLYLIVDFSYRDYKINSYIEYITQLNKDIRISNTRAIAILDYKSSKAYINKIQKSQQSKKNKWEVVVYLTTESDFNKFTQVVPEIQTIDTGFKTVENSLETLTIYEKWMYLMKNKK